jgi:hypothetical protein
MIALGLVGEAERIENLFCNHISKTLMNTHQIMHIYIISCVQNEVNLVSISDEDAILNGEGLHRMKCILFKKNILVEFWKNRNRICLKDLSKSFKKVENSEISLLICNIRLLVENHEYWMSLKIFRK